jgi:Tfp pilus assembly protein PilE
MKQSRHFQTLIIAMPIVCIFASAAIVTQQSVRRAQLEKRFATFQREHDALEKRYKALRKATGAKGDVQGEVDAMSAHHDGDD